MRVPPDKMKQWACRYRLNGTEWGIVVVAEDAAEASRRMRAIGTTGQVDGELVATVNAYPGVGMVLTIITSIRNFFVRQS